MHRILLRQRGLGWGVQLRRLTQIDVMFQAGKR